MGPYILKLKPQIPYIGYEDLFEEQSTPKDFARRADRRLKHKRR